VFGYGSLVDALEAGGSSAELRGYRRRWQVAMDNTRDLPGYKHYLDPETGERPAVYVAYLDLAPRPGSSVKGVVFPVDAPGLAALDRRERNYERREVGDHLDPPAEGRLWAYFGTAAARERFERGQTAGTAVVDRAYFERVRDSPAPPVPVVRLRRVDA
jgi:cation transport regulator ChaC